MEFETILYEVEDHVATITLNRPEQLNVVSSMMVGELRRAYATAETDESVSTMVVTGAGQAFCAGADVTEVAIESRVVCEEPYLSTYPQWEAPSEAAHPFRSVTKPIVTAVNGLCCGAGLDLITTSDITIASDRAEFLEPHVSVGLVAGSEVIRLSRVLPLNLARWIGLTGRHERLSARQACALGLVWEVVEHDRLAERARAIAIERGTELSRGGRCPSTGCRAVSVAGQGRDG